MLAQVVVGHRRERDAPQRRLDDGSVGVQEVVDQQRHLGGAARAGDTTDPPEQRSEAAFGTAEFGMSVELMWTLNGHNDSDVCDMLIRILRRQNARGSSL